MATRVRFLDSESIPFVEVGASMFRLEGSKRVEITDPDGVSRIVRRSSVISESRAMELALTLAPAARTRSLPQAALHFVLDTEGVTSVIPGAKNRQQLEDNAATSDLAPLTEEERKRAIQIARDAGYPLPAYVKPSR